MSLYSLTAQTEKEEKSPFDMKNPAGPGTLAIRQKSTEGGKWEIQQKEENRHIHQTGKYIIKTNYRSYCKRIT